jgi:hypothetical protein
MPGLRLTIACNAGPTKNKKVKNGANKQFFGWLRKEKELKNKLCTNLRFFEFWFVYKSITKTHNKSGSKKIFCNRGQALVLTR